MFYILVTNERTQKINDLFSKYLSYANTNLAHLFDFFALLVLQNCELIKRGFSLVLSLVLVCVLIRTILKQAIDQ